MTIGWEEILLIIFFFVLGYNRGKVHTLDRVGDLIWQALVYGCDEDEKRALEKWINLKRKTSQDLSVARAKLRNNLTRK